MLETTDILESDNVKKVCIFSVSSEYSHCIHRIYCHLVIYPVKTNYTAWGNTELNDKIYFNEMLFI